ncbi:hypothetical protein [Myxacorys almedinensis]|uniref:Uncharacterized protein n=1 Tax=Myxacorys almedinensis A TaxID=2690445 RepID=A0A8J7Z4J6_9CYAN|nr:hypothetical protein [Myxacorys almedinensis]NDJ19874.1 hypothetical protein [Myxacorys almedinensis A]
MHEGVVRDFLNLPGIAGIALIHGRSPENLQGESYPVFYSLDPAFQWDQKEHLSQDIFQVLATIPDGFTLFEFHFSIYQIQIHRLSSAQRSTPTDVEPVLLVIAHDRIDERYPIGLEMLKTSICDNLNGVLTGLNVAMGGASSDDKSTDVSLALAPSIADILGMLNRLSQLTKPYLGTAVIVNYLKSSRSEVAWLQQFSIDRSAQIHFSGDPSQIERALTPQEHQWIRDWVTAFVRRCSHVVRDFGTLVEQAALDEA